MAHFLGMSNLRGRFERQYRCFSVMMMSQAKPHYEQGGKIFLPPDALEELSRLDIQYPMMFSLSNPGTGRVSHAGVLEFLAEPGRVYLPHWMMNNLLLSEGDMITITNVNLQVATFAKFQPCSVDFLDISNPKAVLENTLRNFSCLTTSDTIAIEYNSKVYEIRVLEVKPAGGSNAVSIIECDMQLDFAAPEGYVEPDYKGMKAAEEAKRAEEERDRVLRERKQAKQLAQEQRRFGGSAGQRLDGKKKKGAEDVSEAVEELVKKELGLGGFVPFSPGALIFPRPIGVDPETPTAEGNFEAFSGKGEALRKRSSKQ